MILGIFDIHFDSEEDRRRFEEWWNKLGELAATAPAHPSLEEIDRQIKENQADMARTDEQVEYHLAEARRLQDHADWLTGQAAKLRAERIRLEAEGRAAVAVVEEMLGL